MGAQPISGSHGKPSPAELKTYAHELRHLAAAQRRHADTYEHVLDKVVRLDTDATWQGSYPAETHRQFQSWTEGLKSESDALRAEAKSWESLADKYESGHAGTKTMVMSPTADPSTGGAIGPQEPSGAPADEPTAIADDTAQATTPAAGDANGTGGAAAPAADDPATD